MGLVFSKVCVHLTTWCLYTPLLYLEEFIVLQNHIVCICGVSVIIYHMADSDRREANSGPTCMWKMPQGYPQSYLTKSLALVRSSNETMNFSIPKKKYQSSAIVYISINQFPYFIYYLPRLCIYFISLPCQANIGLRPRLHNYLAIQIATYLAKSQLHIFIQIHSYIGFD